MCSTGATVMGVYGCSEDVTQRAPGPGTAPAGRLGQTRGDSLHGAGQSLGDVGQKYATHSFSICQKLFLTSLTHT